MNKHDQLLKLNRELYSPHSLFGVVASSINRFPPAEPNLVSWWKYEDDLTDEQGTQDLTLQAGTETYVTGKHGKAFDFNGSTILEASDTPYDFDIDDPFSVSLWVKSTDTGTSGLVFKGRSTSGTGWLSYISDGGTSDDRIIFQIGASSTDRIQVEWDNIAVRNGNWHHVVIVWDGSNAPSGAKMYLDSVEQSGTTNFDNSPVATSLNDTNLTISDQVNGVSGRELTGQMDELFVYDKALTQDEVTELFEQ